VCFVCVCVCVQVFQIKLVRVKKIMFSLWQLAITVVSDRNFSSFRHIYFEYSDVSNNYTRCKYMLHMIRRLISIEYNKTSKFLDKFL